MSAELPSRAVVIHGVTAGTPSPDDLDTLCQAAEVGDCLTELGYRVDVVAVRRDFSAIRALTEDRPEVVFNLVESFDGNGRAIHRVAAALEKHRLPFTGSAAQAILATTDKPLSKRRMVAAQIPTADWIGPGGSNRAEPGIAYIVKSAWEDASIGLDDDSVVDGTQVADRIAERTRRFGGEWFAERYIDGREFNLSLIEVSGGPSLLPAAEMVFIDYPPDRPKIIDYAAKWNPASHGYVNTVRRFDLPEDDGPLVRSLSAIARRCWDIFGLRGYARIDFRVDSKGQPFVLEANANPCLSADAGFVAAAEQAGLSQTDIVRQVVFAASGGRSFSTAAEAG